MPPAQPNILSPLARHWTWALVALVVATFAIRACYLGNPLIDADEQFYLLTGDRMLHGSLPYVDIWDRKPVGLFLLYAGIRLLGGDGVLQYQLVAAGFVAATGLLIATIARRISSPGAGLVAGLAYPGLLGLLGGAGGQTPVFYNLAMTAVAMILLDRTAPPADRPLHLPSLRWAGALLMLLVGVAMQIKYNAVFEGLYFGIVLLWLGWRRDPRPAVLATDAALWIAAALLPTALAWGYYVAIGQGGAFAYANFGSIFERSGVGDGPALYNLCHDVERLGPLLVVVLFAELVLRRDAPWRILPDHRAAHLFLAGWLVAAIVGFAIFGTYFNHYTLPLLPPLLIVAAPAFAVRRHHAGAILATSLLLALAIWYPINARRDVEKRGDAAYAYAMAARIRPLVDGPGGKRCLFIFYGAPIYYHLANSCLLTRWPFPYHLSLDREIGALGVVPQAELGHILARHPTVILDKDTDDPEINLPVQAMLRAELARDYRLVFTHRFGGGRHETDRLWERLPGR